MVHRKREWALNQSIGSGSFGEVYLATEVNSGKKAAIKSILKSNCTPEDVAHEREVLSSMKSSHIVELYDFVETQDKYYFVMEYIEGTTVFNYLTSHPRLNEQKVQHLFWQMFSAIGDCHKKNVSHRDIKLENFMISANGNDVKLIDFGLAAYFDPKTKLLNTSCGSPLYACPEVIFGQLHDTTKAEVWSLGIVLFTMLTKMMPFLNSKGQLVVDYAVQGVSRIIPKHVSPLAHDLLTKMLDPKSSSRISMQDIAQHPWMVKAKKLNKVNEESPKLRALFTRSFTPSKPKKVFKPNPNTYITEKHLTIPSKAIPVSA